MLAIQFVTARNAGVSMIAGFLIRLLQDRHPCKEATNNFLGYPSDAINRFIELLDRGGLQYPSPKFMSQVSLLFEILELSRLDFGHEALVKSWVLTLSCNLSDDVFICGCCNSKHTSKIRELILKYVCKIYFVNVCSNATDIADSKPKFENRACSKKIKKL